jgi:hypothetical protein
VLSLDRIKPKNSEAGTRSLVAAIVQMKNSLTSPEPHHGPPTAGWNDTPTHICSFLLTSTVFFLLNRATCRFGPNYPTRPQMNHKHLNMSFKPLSNSSDPNRCLACGRMQHTRHRHPRHRLPYFPPFRRSSTTSAWSFSSSKTGSRMSHACATASQEAISARRSPFPSRASSWLS